MTAEDAKRLAEIRDRYCPPSDNSFGADAMRWLLDQLAARDARIAMNEVAGYARMRDSKDARIAKLEAALKTIRANMYDREVLGYCDAGCGQVAEDALEC